jgi:cobalt-zinc-cadmium efflux system membrane fusion protein
MPAVTLPDERHGENAESGQDDQAGRNENSREPGVLWCNEHDVAENECGICQPQLLANLDLGSGLKVRLADPSSVDQAGVTLGRPKEGGSSAIQTMLGEVSYNRNQLAIVTPLGSGVIMDVLVEAGDAVTSGQLLATLNSPAVAEGKSVLLKALAEASLAQKTYAREKDLYAREISARKDLEEAQSVVATTESDIDFAAQRLLNLGLTAEDIEEVRRTRSTSSLLEVRAPFDGTVVERLAVKGTAAEVGSPLFHVADLSTVWMKLSMSETQLTAVEEGQTVNAQFDAYPGLVFQGEIAWIAPSIDHKTRTFEARVVLPNQHGMLKDGLFGEVSLASGSSMQGLTVPESAIQEVDGQSIVFARLDQDLFETRLVRLGQKRGDQVQILGGLAPSDEIAFDGSYILKSEFLKARLGAGCADD